MKFLSIVLGLFFLAGTSFAAVPQVSPPGSSAQSRVKVTFGNGDSGESEAINNMCASWNVSFFASTDGQASIYAVKSTSELAASGQLLLDFNSDTAFPVAVSSAWPYLRVEVKTAPTSGTAEVWMYCNKNAGGGGGGGLAGLGSSLGPFGEAGTIKVWDTLLTSWTLSMMQVYDNSAIGRAPGSFYAAQQTTLAGATCATADVGKIYAVTDTNFGCTGAGTDFIGCECTSTDAGVLLLPVTMDFNRTAPLFGGGPGGYGGVQRAQGKDDMEIWAVTTTGVAGAEPHRRGVPVPINVDWTGSWDVMWMDRSYEFDSCVQMKRVGGPGYVPIQGHTMMAYLHFAMSQQGAVDTNIEGTTAFIGWTESDNTSFVLNGTGATPADVIQNVNNGFGVLWHDNQFHEVWVRAGTENFSVLHDLSDAAERLLYWQSDRQLHTMQVASLLSPAGGDSTTRRAAYAPGFYPMASTSWKPSFELSPQNGQPNPAGNTGFTAVRAACEDQSKPNPSFIELLVSQQKILQVGTGF